MTDPRNRSEIIRSHTASITTVAAAAITHRIFQSKRWASRLLAIQWMQQDMSTPIVIRAATIGKEIDRSGSYIRLMPTIASPTHVQNTT